MIRNRLGGAVRGRYGAFAVLAVFALLVAACGGSGQSGDVSSNQPVDVTLSQAIASMGNAGIYVAIDKGFYKDQHVNLKLNTLQSGATTTQAMASGSVDMVASGAFDVAAAVSKGVPFEAFFNGSGITMEMCASKSFAQGKGLTSSSSLSDIMQSWKGGTIGITGANSAPDLVVRYLLQKYGHLKPDQDVKIVALGSIASEVQAMSRGQIDGFLQSPPGCEQANATGNAVTLLRPSQVPGFTKTPLGVMYTTKNWANGHKSAMSRVGKATVQGQAYALQHPDETMTILQKYLPGLKPDLMKDAWGNVVQPTMSKDGRMSSGGWTSVSDLLKTSGSIQKPLDTKEGVVWTNSYLPST